MSTEPNAAKQIIDLVMNPTVEGVNSLIGQQRIKELLGAHELDAQYAEAWTRYEGELNRVIWGEWDPATKPAVEAAMRTLGIRSRAGLSRADKEAIVREAGYTDRLPEHPHVLRDEIGALLTERARQHSAEIEAVALAAANNELY